MSWRTCKNDIQPQETRKLVFRDDQQISLRSVPLWTHAVTPGAFVILGWCEAFVAPD